MEFLPFPKIPRYTRECVITEKLDGTNASVLIAPLGTPTQPPSVFDNIAYWDDFDTNTRWGMWAGSRVRWLQTWEDNYGFANWVRNNARELQKLGEGHHFGEWWGNGIQRGYGLTEKKFSLFNTHRWDDAQLRPKCCDVVPTMYRGDFDSAKVQMVIEDLAKRGSMAAPGFMNPEGIIIYHTAGNLMFKKTIKGDEEGKSYEGHEKKIREPKPPRDPNKGGRRKELVPIDFPDRRKPFDLPLSREDVKELPGARDADTGPQTG